MKSGLLHLPKLIQNKPSAFYKQRDLGYGLDKIRKVQLGTETISFDHTGFVRCPEPTKTYLKILDDSGGLKQIAKAPKSSFISYNLEQIHEVLTLNFFRFMDTMTDGKWSIDLGYIKSFYNKTGVPVLLNTSFNGPKEPIVETPEDAIRCFYETGLDHLVINNFIIHKNL
jgi:hypothetical protein